MTRLLLIRHGAAANHGLVAGTRTCRGLSPLGHIQARALAQRLTTEQRNLRITTIYTTTVPRARQPVNTSPTHLAFRSTPNSPARTTAPPRADTSPKYWPTAACIPPSNQKHHWRKEPSRGRY